jgi:hypothetical protein
VAEVEAFDLPSLVPDLLDHPLVDVQRREHQQFDVEFEGDGQVGGEVILVVVLLMGIPAEILTVVPDRFAELLGLVDHASEAMVRTMGTSHESSSRHTR